MLNLLICDLLLISMYMIRYSLLQTLRLLLVSVALTLVLCTGHININDNCFLVMDNDLRVS